MKKIPVGYEWFVAAGILSIGMLFGLLLEKVILPRLRKFSSITGLKKGDILAESLKGFLLPASILASLYAVAQYLPFEQKAVHLYDKLLYIGAVALATFFVSRIAVQAVGRLNRGSKDLLPSTSILLNLSRIVVFILGILFILQSLGISIAPILTALGVGGLAVALALQDTLSNFFSGIYMLLSKKIRPGDYIRIDALNEGYVTDIAWRETTLRSLADNIIIIPNAKVASALVVNFSLPDREVAVAVEAGVSYASDLDKVERVTLEAARETMRETAGGVDGAEPSIRYHGFGDAGVNFTVTLRARDVADLSMIKHAFIKKLHDRYKAEGIDRRDR